MFVRLGVTSFGGPIAHLGYFRAEFVARRRWLSEQQYAELVTLCQFLPGPTSSQLGFAVGLSRAGYRGAIAAWAAFTLPSVLLLLLVAAGTELLTGPIAAGAFTGLAAVAVAVVAHAVWGMARTLTPDITRLIIAILAAALTLLIPGPLGPVVVIAGGLAAGLTLCRSAAHVPERELPLRFPVTARTALGCLFVLAALLLVLPLLAAVTPHSLLGFADAFTRTGALVFGGGHVLLPLLQAEPAIASAVTAPQFLAGYGAAQSIPGPLFSFAAYLGAVAQPGGGLLTAAVALVSVFLPGMLLLLGVLPFWQRLRTVPAAAAALRGANAAVVGVLAAALYRPLLSTEVTDPVALGIAGVCLALLLMRVPAWVTVLVAAVGGAAAGLLGILSTPLAG